MPRLNEIRVEFHGGMRGKHIDIKELIRKETVIDILSFEIKPSQVRGCERRCDMQIRIKGEYFVTWHSSDVLTNFLQDCKNQEEEVNPDTGEKYKNFPIENVVIYIEENRGYYLKEIC